MACHDAGPINVISVINNIIVVHSRWIDLFMEMETLPKGFLWNTYAYTLNV